MHSERENMMAVRREILDLLRQQMAALDSPLGLTEDKLRECYERHLVVQELRDKLQAASTPQVEAETASSLGATMPAPANSRADQHVS
jgi:hypothetical protein